MARLGATLAEVDPAERRMIVGVTLPTRGYASAIAVAAHVLRRNQLDPMEPSDADSHFEMLRSLPAGTPIRFLKGGKSHLGRMLGIVVSQDAECVKIETRGMRQTLPRGIAMSVRPTQDAADADRALIARAIVIPPLVSAFAAGPAAAAYVTQSRIDCAIVGVLTAMTADLIALEFRADTREDDRGCLQELARVSGVRGASSSHRSLLVPAAANEEDVPTGSPRLVVFDGGKAYVRFGHLWTSSHQLVVIDRSLPSAEPGAEALNLAYFERAGEPDLGVGECPPSMELISFQASRA
jgi:hypothetical protein